MAELTTAQRDRLHDSSFAYIDKQGERHLPINDATMSGTRSPGSIRRTSRSTSAKHAAARKIMAAAKRHDIEVDDASDVAKAAKR